jgi:hypothetical protein
MSLNVEHAPARPRTVAPDIKALVLKLRGKNRKNDTKWIAQRLCERLHGDDDCSSRRRNLWSRTSCARKKPPHEFDE